MKLRRAGLVTILLTAWMAPGLAAQACTSIGPLFQEDLRMCGTGPEATFVLTRTQMDSVNARLEHLEALEEEFKVHQAAMADVASLRTTIATTIAVKDSLIAVQDEELQDYDRLTDVLRRQNRLGKILSVELGAGVTGAENLGFMAGVSLFRFRISALMEEAGVGAFVGYRLPIF